MKIFYSIIRNTYKSAGLDTNSAPYKLINYHIGGNIADLVGKMRGFNLKKNDPLGLKIQFLFNWYEAKSIEACKKIIRPGMVVLDIGANIGFHTRVFSNLVGAKGKVYAFEPDPENYALLLKNISALKFKNVVAVNKAVSDFNGGVDFYKTPGSGLHSLYTSDKATRKSRVESVTIDSFFAEAGGADINFVKIDVEGAEPKAIAGMSATLRRSPDINMLVEINPEALGRDGASPESFTGNLGALGFTSEGVEEFPDGSYNILCRKNTRDGRTDI